MTVRKNINLEEAVRNFSKARDCDSNAPDRTYTTTKKVLAITGQHIDAMIKEFKELGIVVDGSDRCYEVEAFLYSWARDGKGPAISALISGEGFGERMNEDNPKKYIDQAIRDRDALNAIRRKLLEDAGDDAFKLLEVRKLLESSTDG